MLFAGEFVDAQTAMAWGLVNRVVPPFDNRDVRLAMTLALDRQAFIDGLAESMVPNHDALDAACAALVAGLHRLGLTTPFGSPSDGGELWMPDGAKLAALLPSPM